jgi:hypothetical protein
MAQVLSCQSLPLGAGFSPMPFHVGFMVNKVVWGRFSYEHFSFPCSFILY